MLCQRQLSRWQRSMKTQSVHEINKLANWELFLLKSELLNRQLGLFYLNEDSGEDRASCYWYIGQPQYLQNEKINVKGLWQLPGTSDSHGRLYLPCWPHICTMSISSWTLHQNSNTPQTTHPQCRVCTETLQTIHTSWGHLCVQFHFLTAWKIISCHVGRTAGKVSLYPDGVSRLSLVKVTAILYMRCTRGTWQYGQQ